MLEKLKNRFFSGQTADETLIAQARISLLAWNVLILGSVLILVLFLAYFTVSSTLSSELDNELHQATMRQIDSLRFGTPPDRDQYNGESIATFTWLIQPDGTLLASSQGMSLTSGISTNVLKQANSGYPAYESINLPGAGNTRILIEPLYQNGQLATILVVGTSLHQLDDNVHQLILTLAIICGLGIALAIAGAYLLAHRSLIPVRQSLERHRTFIADASHEMRTPLSLLRAQADILQRSLSSKSGNDDDKELSQDLLSEVDRLTGITTEMLDLAALDKQADDVSSVYLPRLLKETLENYQNLGERKKLNLQVSSIPEVSIKGSYSLLLRLFSNLIDNAIKYTPEEGSIQVNTWVDNRHAFVTVKDSGIGISQEDLPLIFNRFYRAEKSRRRNSESSATSGTGLGLAIAQEIAIKHSGKITAESIPGTGSTFTVQLPVD